MSILIKGIDIPKGQSLMVFIANNGAIVCSGEDGVKTTEAIQIPKGHGDIKDVSEAIKKWCEGCAFKDTEECADCKDKEMCKYAPTLLEREETE